MSTRVAGVKPKIAEGRENSAGAAGQERDQRRASRSRGQPYRGPRPAL